MEAEGAVYELNEDMLIVTDAGVAAIHEAKRRATIDLSGRRRGVSAPSLKVGIWTTISPSPSEYGTIIVGGSAFPHCQV
jgi:hypothetical protein